MNKRIINRICTKMILTILLFGYSLGITSFLTVLYVRGEHWRKLYQDALQDNYSLERVRVFFQRIEPLLKILYPIIDKLNKQRGRPATDRRFQLRFVFFWKFFAPVAPAKAIKRLNKSPELQKIIKAPTEPYTRYSFRRFLLTLGEDNLMKMGFVLIIRFVNQGLIDLKQVILDSFPIYSFLNTAKCLKMPKFDPALAQRFYKQLSLDLILKLFPPQHWKAAPLIDKIKVWIHYYLWDVPSVTKNQQLIFGNEHRGKVMGLTKGWKTAGTYSNFLRMVNQLPNFNQIEQALMEEVCNVLRQLKQLPTGFSLEYLEALCGVFHTPHRWKDAGITLNHCAAKEQTFMGRGGLITGETSLEIPLFVRVTPRYKQNERGILTFLTDLQKYFDDLLPVLALYGDSEFGTSKILQMIEDVFKARALIERYGKSKNKLKLTRNQRRIRKTIERIIARLETNFQVEHPRFLGGELVAVHTQLCLLSDLLLAGYNVEKQNYHHPHALP